MQNRYDWATEDIYASVSDWESDYNKIQSSLDFSCFKGKLDKKSEFIACMKKQEELGRILEKLGVYAMMKHDENTKDSVYDSLNSKIESLYSQYAQSCSFITPELTALSEQTLIDYVNDKDLVEYDYMLKTVLNEKEHVLSEAEERNLAMASETFGGFRDIFTKIDNADLEFGKIKVGLKSVPLTHGTYGVLMHSNNRKVRKKAFSQYYKSYVSLINTISSTYFGSVKKDVFLAKCRNYKSALEKALKTEDVPEIVYHNLLKAVEGALPSLHSYMEQKKRALKLKEMHMYDVYVPTVENAELKMSYDDAYKLVIEGLSVLGEEYSKLLTEAYENRYIDVYEKPGKRSGAYSVSAFDTHPYVLLNYQPTTHDVFTIAHEMGHSIHSYYSNKNQPYAKADYKIFVAEVASTVNEVLLIKYLLNKEQDNKVKKYLLSYLLEMIRTTLFRQTQFAEFEEFSHSSVENGVPLTKDNMCEKYLELNKKYYGQSIISDEEIKYEWARIPHFYRAFYVYKYATGIISALKIADRILTEGKPAVDDYVKFLSSGSSNGPVELLKIAGVDLTTFEPFNSAFKCFNDALEEFIKL